jgi:hypothetical protein
VTIAQSSLATRNCLSLVFTFSDRSFVTPFISSACGLFFSLGSLFHPPILCFQSFADSFAKTPGVWGYLGGTLPPRAIILGRRLLFMLLKSLFPEVFYIHIYTKRPSVSHPPNHAILACWSEDEAMPRPMIGFWTPWDASHRA